ncbi:MAG: oxygen-independent coproporphyrinogen III oxidase [Paracoccus sp. (in: a-proteobacteria)]|uniref:oxygen-independent coproporphyrinogen III oxidase n=1 Tax=Paracoccus sp. TaxID=267 RepID=UPI0039E64F88
MEQQSQLERHGLFKTRVPRYTSYPTAPHFGPAIGAAEFGEWLAAIPAQGSISLYLHVPFCRRLCWFCACRTQGTQSLDPVRSYAQTLIREIALLKTRLAPGITLSRLHWGGGTPTLMPPEMIREIAAALHSAFPLKPDAEFSVEIDPSEIDEARMDALAEAGLTRASIGIQDFDPEIQRIIGREQSFAQTRRAVRMIRDRNIASLNADILYGLPRQDPLRIAETVQKLLALSPDRVALYGYAHVPWMARRQVMIPDDSLPLAQDRLALFETARRLFLADGYDQVGIDHFARPGDGLARAQGRGRLRRNFQGYTDDRSPALIGLGASAISRLPQGYAQNAPATNQHIAQIRQGRFSTTRGHRFTAEDLWRGRMIEALMCDFHIHAPEFTAAHGLSPARLSQILTPVARHFGNLVRIDDQGLTILPEGRPLTRIIARMFDAYEASSSAHSSAI